MLFGEGLPFINDYVKSLNEAIAIQSPGKQLSKLQQCWLSFVILGILVTNSLCWARFEKFSLKGYSTAGLCWMFRKALIPWQYLLTASTFLILSQYKIKDGFLVIDDSDNERSKNTTDISGAHKIKDKKRGGFFNGQCIVFLLLVSDKITLPVGFDFHEPDPEMVAWRKQEKRLVQKKVKKCYRPEKPKQKDNYPSKKKIALKLIEKFISTFETIKIKAVLVDAFYNTKDFIDKSFELTGQRQVISQIKGTQLINVNGRNISARDFFSRYSGKTKEVTLRDNNKKITYCSGRFKVKSHGKKYYIIALKYDNEAEYRYLIANDISWRDIDIIKAFAFRWLVEVFIQDWKTHEGWSQLSKQRGSIGADRGLTLSLLCDHALFLHEDQKSLLKNNAPAATVGTLKNKVMMESLTSFIGYIVENDAPQALFSEYKERISELFQLSRSTKKHMGAVNMEEFVPAKM